MKFHSNSIIKSRLPQTHFSSTDFYAHKLEAHLKIFETFSSGKSYHSPTPPHCYSSAPPLGRRLRTSAIDPVGSNPVSSTKKITYQQTEVHVSLWALLLITAIRKYPIKKKKESRRTRKSEQPGVPLGHRRSGSCSRWVARLNKSILLPGFQELNSQEKWLLLWVLSPIINSLPS